MKTKNIVLVHGAFADGSSWSSVITSLQKGGYNVTAPQFPLTTLEADVTRLRQVLTAQSGPTLVVGHSYAGQIMTALGTDAPNVVGLIYVAAFALEQGETIVNLGANYPPPAATAHLRVDSLGFAWIPQDDFLTYFAADVDEAKARVMYAIQQPIFASLFGDAMSTPAWKALPTWYLVTKNDQAIAPDLERFFAKRMGATTVEINSSHVAMVSHPDAVTDLIVRAAETVAEKMH